MYIDEEYFEPEFEIMKQAWPREIEALDALKPGHAKSVLYVVWRLGQKAMLERDIAETNVDLIADNIRLGRDIDDRNP